ncbi:MAG: patatin family protein [Peptococcaceae bacterium]|jgi:predicted patatin/cPLA2 family phospholipase|nr:patatin family protein [Peptococcaceae bacterium]
MSISNVGLVLEGGGMRGLFSCGVLDFFLDQELIFPYVIGVSAGACNAASYISRQKGRNKTVNIDYIRDPRYLSLRNYWRERSLFGMDFLFQEIPIRLVPYDFTAYAASEQQYVIGTTDCRSGQACYFSKTETQADVMQLLRASSSLPFFSPIVHYQGKALLDGGVADPIPLNQARKDGYARNVLILTRDIDYRKSPAHTRWLGYRFYQAYPELVETMARRHEVYNQTLTEILQGEAAGELFVIRPQDEIKVGRMERDTNKLTWLYEAGYQTAEGQYVSLQRWLEEA